MEDMLAVMVTIKAVRTTIMAITAITTNRIMAIQITVIQIMDTATAATTDAAVTTTEAIMVGTTNIIPEDIIHNRPIIHNLLIITLVIPIITTATAQVIPITVTADIIASMPIRGGVSKALAGL